MNLYFTWRISNLLVLKYFLAYLGSSVKTTSVLNFDNGRLVRAREGTERVSFNCTIGKAIWDIRHFWWHEGCVYCFYEPFFATKATNPSFALSQAIFSNRNSNSFTSMINWYPILNPLISITYPRNANWNPYLKGGSDTSVSHTVSQPS